MISTIIHTTALLCLLASAAEAWSSSSSLTPRHHRPTLSSSPLTKDTCNKNNSNNIHHLTAATAAAVRRTNNSVTPFNQHYRGKHVIMSATTAAAPSSFADCNNNDKNRAALKSNIQRIGNIYHQLLHQIKSSLKAVVSNTKLGFMSFTIMFSILVPKMALARSSTTTTTTTSSISTTKARGNNGVGAGRKVGKFVVTLGAIGAGVTSANLIRGKFNYCSNEEDEEDCDGKKREGVQQQQQQVGGGGSDGGVGNNGGSVNGNKATTKKKKEESVVEPLSEKWIQQQLNDVEKRSIVLNDAIKMQQQQQTQQQQQVTKGGNKSTHKKVSIGNSVGINNNNKSPLVKNLDSKIELLQRQQNERTIEEQRRITKESDEMNQKALIAKEVAEKKIEAAELEYKQQQAAQKQQVVAVSKEIIQTEQTRLNNVLVGYGGLPAKSKEEDLELTTQIILEHVNTIDNNEGGGVVDDDDE